MRSKMQSNNNHIGEHTTYPADKMIPKEEIVRIKGQVAKRTIKKIHTRRSRKFNKKIEGA